ncbi:uncharacterized protein SEPMUDRAFT_164175 [Sphaerulina musiva SO2202]|uniref:Mmc1 C-terminal domain-containing protein n=1 Tax=Sphaerulina musiva (strain SO2202) TaxID=692275 RepID=N1QKT8_SPHMS|nr:uncharacterized protein SEPMUDRAFT_164175 [Sphaerulina musiva SO2202]EMF11791.1 hypothetical protein SEPMUDRAFT_164175 [Sphaerulina musiva SO2202]
MPPRTSLVSRASRLYYASLASSTAINAPTSVPPHLHALYQSLLHLESSASSYIDLSRLQLALRSLESADALIRIAFLGLGGNGNQAARRLVRVLLADALSDGVEQWERELLDGVEGSVLVKYGEMVQDVGIVGGGRDGRVRELRVPSPLLKRLGVEILVTGLNASEERASDELEATILVPALTIPGAGGRVGFVRYPVHKAVVVTEGVSGAVELGRLPKGLLNGHMIQSALSLPLRKEEGIPKNERDGDVVDVGLAEHALGLFRENRANGAVFSQEWQASKVGSITNWLANSTKVDEKGDGLKPAVRDLLGSLLVKTQSAVESADSSSWARCSTLSVPESKRIILQEALATWCKDAHQDLQTNLSTAFLGPAWKRTTWWRLFWRIDEVSISAAEVLRRGWLVEAEQSLAFLSGRLLESGVATEAQLRAELMQLPPLLSKIREETGLNALFNPPWPQTVNLAREQILHEAVPALHVKAQRFMLAALSTMGGSSALAAWLWVASGGVALYESGAIAALGLVWALRRLQKVYGKEREVFAGAVRENGRRVLADVESRLQKVVNEGGRVAVREEDIRERESARKVVQVTREALGQIQTPEGRA